MQRVTFQFPTDVEVRYVATMPPLGSRVRSGVGDTFVVQAIKSDTAGGWVIVAVREDGLHRTSTQGVQHGRKAGRP
jgi:hypothetical protein